MRRRCIHPSKVFNTSHQQFAVKLAKVVSSNGVASEDRLPLALTLTNSSGRAFAKLKGHRHAHKAESTKSPLNFQPRTGFHMLRSCLSKDFDMAQGCVDFARCFVGTSAS